MSASVLHIGTNLTLPIDAVTEPIGVFGNRGSGKTNTAVVFVEELLDAGQQAVVIDPTDAWWGLKSSRDGKSAGYPVVVLGGRHADLPLAEDDAALSGLMRNMNLDEYFVDDSAFDYLFEPTPPSQ